MDTKTLISRLILEKRRYWGQLLYKEYYHLFQKIHSNQLLADLISDDLGIALSVKQIENIKKNYHKFSKTLAIQTTHLNDESEDIKAQSIYDKIYSDTQKTDFNLDNL